MLPSIRIRVAAVLVALAAWFAIWLVMDAIYDAAGSRPDMDAIGSAGWLVGMIVGSFLGAAVWLIGSSLEAAIRRSSSRDDMEQG